MIVSAGPRVVGRSSLSAARQRVRLAVIREGFVGNGEGGGATSMASGKGSFDRSSVGK